MADYVADETTVQKAINDGHHWLSLYRANQPTPHPEFVISALLMVATSLAFSGDTAELARKDEIIAELKRGLAEKGNR